MTKTVVKLFLQCITEHANRQGMTKQELLQEINAAVELICKMVSLQAEIKKIEAGGETTNEAIEAGRAKEAVKPTNEFYNHYNYLNVLKAGSLFSHSCTHTASLGQLQIVNTRCLLQLL